MREELRQAGVNTVKKTNDEVAASGSSALENVASAPQSERREVVRVENIEKHFQDNDVTIHALRPTSFTLYAGEFVAIIGPSGSGKSTLLTLLGGLQHPSAGRIILDGQDTTELAGRDLVHLRREKIGFVLQSANLVPYLSVRDQMVLVDKVEKRKFSNERALKLAQQLNIERQLNAYPGELSGGERQRAAIMRALYPHPALLLADEPTAALDSQRAFDVVDMLASEAHSEGVTVVMVTHDERMLRHCDRILRIEDGQMSEQNPADYR